VSAVRLDGLLVPEALAGRGKMPAEPARRWASSGLGAYGHDFGSMVARLMQPPDAVRVDTLLMQFGLIDHRRHARKVLKLNDVRGVVVTGPGFMNAERGDEDMIVDDSDDASPGEVVGTDPLGRMIHRIASKSARVDPLTVTVNGVPLDHPGPLHLAFYKPPGYVCTHSTEEGPRVYDLLPSDLMVRQPLLSSVGRLDSLASGLLLFSQSGELINRLTYPDRHLPRTYTVRLARPLRSDGHDVLSFASGRLEIVDGYVCRPALLEPHPTDPTAARVTVFEGHHRLVRRMFAAVQNRVLALHRTHFGPLSLESLGLAPGEWCHLSASHLYRLLESSARPTKRELRRLQLQAMRQAAQKELPPPLRKLFPTTPEGQASIALLQTAPKAQADTRAEPSTDSVDVEAVQQQPEESLIDVADRLALPSITEDQLEGLLRGSEAFVSLFQRAAASPKGSRSAEAFMLRTLISTKLHLYNERAKEIEASASAVEAPASSLRGVNPSASSLQLQPSVGRSLAKQQRPATTQSETSTDSGLSRGRRRRVAEPAEKRLSLREYSRLRRGGSNQ
jgi:16S rRNA pseudouridine516 synthase